MTVLTFRDRTRPALTGFAVLATLLAAPFAAHAQQTYVALGDSYAFGYTTSTAPASDGNQGYAGILRDIYDLRNGAQTVDLINLAIPGETTGSFLNGQTVDANGIVDGIFRNPGLNTNYNTTPNTLQRDKFVATVTSLAGLGRQVDYVTLQAGGNDILNLFVQPNFLALTPLAQNNLVTARFNALGTNLATELFTIKALAPNAKISVIGYADVFAGLGANNPLPQSTFLTLQANSIISQVAALTNVNYVDIYTPFLGHETEYSRIQTIDAGAPNFHPTPLGYQVIAGAVAAPEAGSIAFMLAAAVPIAGVIARRRK